MVRYVAGGASALLLIAAGFFIWRSGAEAEDVVPPPPQARSAPWQGGAGPRLASPPAQPERTREARRFARADRDRDGRRDWRDRGHRRDWSRDWRRDRRYDWYGYRNRYGSLFRLGRYHDPYRYGYRRFSIGFNLWPSYYGSRYWLNDPWHYRLPPAYGPYRWVRYYDDALLVNIYTGQVVDVIYNVFW